jgi:hypothetical protein
MKKAELIEELKKLSGQSGQHQALLVQVLEILNQSGEKLILSVTCFF